MANGNNHFTIIINEEQRKLLSSAMHAMIGQSKDLAGIYSEDDIEEMELMQGMLDDCLPRTLNNFTA